MSAQHTQGRLVVATGSARMLISPDRVPCVAETYNDGAHENARRLVACWNACEGIDTDDVEVHSVNIINKLHDDAAKRVLSERDEMLRVLKKIVSQIDQGGKGGKVFSRDDCISQARKAIDKATGEPA